MGREARGSSVLVLFFFLLASCCHGSRNIQAFHVATTPTSNNSGHFLGFLPRSTPIPPSAPSKQHNDIGLQGYGKP
ncbi:unnamed protein product [Spirodela intermedia]|uniref:Uncharacterized protein n=2 Tax=Spirodela intermedia TaxID=51605 RepID=A0A7I8IRD9_SPIIN|nr:unnamed protein product [Spirodela intermedia]CAA6660512.1 unnamed protein product [Spirodela intermedia]CAA7396862.1 unnamed protein product [Spirodela intermedia]